MTKFATEDVVPTMAGSDHDVFDLSAMVIQPSRVGEGLHTNCEEEEEQQLLPTCSSSSSSRSPLPPLETLSAFTDDDSVSSVSTQGSANIIQRRSVFSQYWKMTGQEPVLPRIPSVDGATAALPSGPAVPTPAQSLSDVPENGLMFLPTHPENEVVSDMQVPARPSSTSHGTRRSILSTPPRSNSVPCQLSSYPSLLCGTSATANTGTTTSSVRPLVSRKTQSSPHLGQKQPGASCLREPRFSPVKGASSSSLCSASSFSRQTTDQSSTSSVRFDMDAVAVRHFEPPKENYAEEGWSQYFQYGII